MAAMYDLYLESLAMVQPGVVLLLQALVIGLLLAVLLALVVVVVGVVLVEGDSRR